MAEKANDKPRAVRSHDVALDKEYVQWIQDIKQRFHNETPGRSHSLIFLSYIYEVK